MEPSLIKADETVDELFRGRLRILQKRVGYRLSMDPILLAHFASPLRGRVIDLGTGCGVIPLILSLREDRAEPIVGLDLFEELVDMARRSVRINNQEGKVDIRRGDYRKINELFPPESFHHVISNPPYHPVDSGRGSSHPQRASARHEVSGTIRDVISAARHLLGTKGRLWLSYPPFRLATLADMLRGFGLEPKRIRAIHGRRDAPARMLLVESVRGGREGLEMVSPLILYQDGNEYTEELKAIYETT